MCSIDQYHRCRPDFDSCSHYDHTDLTPCSHFVKSIDNSKMFSRRSTFSGRIGKLEFGLTNIIGILICAGSSGLLLQWTGGTFANQHIEGLVVGFILISIIRLSLIGVAAYERIFYVQY